VTARRVVLLGEEVLRIPTEKIKGFGEETQAKGILIETTVSNTGAQKLYESNGYQKVTEWLFYERKN